MGQFDHLTRLQVQAELREVERLPKYHWGNKWQELHARLDQIVLEEQQAESSQQDRHHVETLAESKRQFAASVRSARLAALLALLAIPAAWASAWYARAQFFASLPPATSSISSSPTPPPTGPPLPTQPAAQSVASPSVSPSPASPSPSPVP